MNRSTIATFSSHVMRGAVGNRAIVPLLENLGHAVWAIPTVVMPFHPGHGQSTVSRPDADQFAASVDDLIGLLEQHPVDAVLSGYLGAPDQAGPIAAFVRAAKAANPNCFYLCDPICGDAGRLYVPEATATAIQDTLLPLADMTTPNSFEHGWMIEGRPEKPDRHQLAPETVITSIAQSDPARIGIRLIVDGRTVEHSHARLPGAPNGTGDLFAAAYGAARLRGAEPAQAMERAVETVLTVLEVTQSAASDSLIVA